MFLKFDTIERLITNRRLKALHPGSSVRAGKFGNRAAYKFLLSDRFTSGEGSYGVLNVHASSNTQERLIIGKYCQISGDSHFLLGGEHHTNWVSTYPIRELLLHEGTSSFSKGPIILEDEVWIGQGALILSGVRIGKGAIVSAGALVVKDVPPYAIVGGCPAKVIRMRFSNNVIQKLIKVDIPYQHLSVENLQVLERPVTDSNIDTVIDLMKTYEENK